jgi:Plasmid pRiA4b ORF-3-like protein
MTLDLQQLDELKELDDQSTEALGSYIQTLIEEFRQSPEGQEWLSSGQVDADYFGSWVDSLLYFGFAYLNVTLPNMSAKDVKAVLTDLFPQKISLRDPEEAETAIPELLAFWNYLKRTYKLSQANAVLKALVSMQPNFKHIMNDSSRFGMAKFFLQSGLEAGFDMITEEGLTAFQSKFNQVPESGETVKLPDLGLGISMLSSLVGDEDEDNLTQSIRAQFVRGIVGLDDASVTLSDATIAKFEQQTITETEPGTILKDFQLFLDMIGGQKIPLSGTRHNLPPQFLLDLNERLSVPINVAFQRPVQKSYPNVGGLYLLAKASGLAEMNEQGKKPCLVLNAERLAEWQQLNATERYLTLLEAWLVRARLEMLGEPPEGRFQMDQGSKCVSFWRMPRSSNAKFAKYSEQSGLHYYPNLFNLALMEMFGLVTITSGKPDSGKGWRIKQIKKLPWGEAVVDGMNKAITDYEFLWPVDRDPYAPFGALKPVFGEYFPEWQNTLSIEKPVFRPGVHTFKVTLDKIWRRIAIAGDLSLSDLSHLILKSVDFDSDHLDLFRYQHPTGSTLEIYHPYAEEQPSTDEVRVGDIPLKPGTSMTYIFDYGDWWKFQVLLESVGEISKKQNYQAVLERHGTPPEQYPNWD